MSRARILYAGEVGPGETSLDRAEALERLGHHVRIVSPNRAGGLLGKVWRKLAVLAQVGPYVSGFNREIRKALLGDRYDVLWIDKGWLVHADVLRLAKVFGSHVVLFNNDNPWGEHEDGKWRLLFSGLNAIDQVFAPRVATDKNYKAAGVGAVDYVDFAFEPQRHFPPSERVEFEHEICFVGTAFDDGGGVRIDRIQYILKLAELLPGRISVFGHGWAKALDGKEDLFRVIGGAQLGPAYAETIWKSKINLSFVTHDNWEESSHKAFEITACGGCLLAERSDRLVASFEENSEAVFFTSVEECVSAAERLLSDEELRLKVSKGGENRAWSSGYDNASRLRQAFSQSEYLRQFI